VPAGAEAPGPHLRLTSPPRRPRPTSTPASAAWRGRARA